MKKIKALLKKQEQVKWLFSGDSITHGALHTYGWRDYTELFSERIRWEMGRGFDIVIKTGISGTGTNSPLENFDTLIGQFKPHVVFLMFGGNDCKNQRTPPDKFAGNLKAIIGKVKNIGGLPVLQTTSPVIAELSPERAPYWDNYMDIVRDTAAAEKVPLIDHNALWKKNIKKQIFWMSDSLHPNQFGHMALARLICEELGIYDPKSNVCSMFFPGAAALEK